MICTCSAVVLNITEDLVSRGIRIERRHSLVSDVLQPERCSIRFYDVSRLLGPGEARRRAGSRAVRCTRSMGRVRVRVRMMVRVMAMVLLTTDIMHAGVCLHTREQREASDNLGEIHGAPGKERIGGGDLTNIYTSGWRFLITLGGTSVARWMGLKPM